MSRGLLSKSYPEKTANKRIKSAPNVIVTPPKNLEPKSSTVPINSRSSSEDLVMLQKPTSISVTRNTNITLKALGSLGYGDTVDQTIDILVNLLSGSFTSDEKRTLDYLIESFKNFEVINFEKKKKNEHRNKK